MSDFDVKKYAEELAQAAGASDVEKQAFLKVLESDAVAKRLKDEVMARSDYSRNMDALKKDRDALEAQKGEWMQWYRDVLATNDQNKAAVAQKEAELSRYKTQYGDLEGGDRTLIATPTEPVITKKMLEEELQKMGANLITVTKQAMKISADHLKRFGEVIDPDALEQHAIKSGLPLAKAYEDFIAPKLGELQQKDVEARIAAAREEGRKDALSQHHIPLDTAPKEASAFRVNMQRKDKPAETPFQAFKSAYEDAAASKG